MSSTHLVWDINIKLYICLKKQMEIHKKIKKMREDKHFSQDALAHALGLTQSQYCRRESGEIRFSATEIPVVAKELQTTISNLYGEESNSFTIHTQNGGNFGQYVSIPERLIELYEARLKEYESRLQEKDEMISMLKK